MATMMIIPTNAPEVVLGMPTLRSSGMMHKAETTDYRFMCLRKWNGAMAKHARFGILKSRLLITVQDRMSFGKEFKTYIPERIIRKSLIKPPRATVVHWTPKVPDRKDGTETFL